MAHRAWSASLHSSTSGNNLDFHLHTSDRSCLPVWDTFPVRSIIQVLDHRHINHLSKSDQVRIKSSVAINARYHIIKCVICQS